MNRRPESELEPPIPPLAPVRPTAPGGTEGDDAALAAWFALLPDRVPQPGFVLRVMSARLVGPATVLNLWIGSVADLATHLTEGLSTWNAFASVGRVLGRALALPPFLALFALNAALALAAFRGLVALSSKRSPSHAGFVALSL